MFWLFSNIRDALARLISWLLPLVLFCWRTTLRLVAQSWAIVICFVVGLYTLVAETLHLLGKLYGFMSSVSAKVAELRALGDPADFSPVQVQLTTWWAHLEFLNYFIPIDFGFVTLVLLFQVYWSLAIYRFVKSWIPTVAANT